MGRHPARLCRFRILEIGDNMDYKDWKILKSELEEHVEEYQQVASWCNASGYHIEEDELYYFTAINPPLPQPTLEQRVQMLENEYNMCRWQREGILAEGSGYSDYAKAKAQEIEDLAEELRRQQLEGNN